MKLDLVPPSPTAKTSAEPAVAASSPAGAAQPGGPTAASPGQAAASASPGQAAAGTTTDERPTTAFRPVEGGTQLQSGEKLLVEAYAAIWIILFALVLFSWRRQRRLDERMAWLQRAIDKARREEDDARDRRAQSEGGA